MRIPTLAVAAAALLLGATTSSAVPPPEVNPAYAVPGEAIGAQAVASAALVENPLPWNGKRVLFTGEAIGESMVRGDMAWIHLNDDAYMWKNIEEGATLGGFNSGQAIWLPADRARLISFFGDYKHEGDVVTVTGTFNAACREHGGDMDIHATELAVVKTGHVVSNPVNRRRAGIAGGLLLASLLFWLAKRRAALRRI